MAAVLAAGEGFGLSHLSAAVHLKAWRRAWTGIDVIAPTRRTIPGVRLHRCRNLDPRDLTIHRGIPVTTMARTLVDLTDVLTEHQLGSAGTKSVLEDQVLAHIRATDLPAPLVNAGVQTPHKLSEVDLFWPTDGSPSRSTATARPRTQREDAERNRLLTQPGLEVVRVKPPPRPHPAADPRPP